MDKWTEYLEQGGQIDVMYCDFEKAFDKVSHNRLIYKIKLYGFSKDIITWIQDFLKDRKFKSKSKCKLLSMGQCNECFT